MNTKQYKQLKIKELLYGWPNRKNQQREQGKELTSGSVWTNLMVFEKS